MISINNLLKKEINLHDIHCHLEQSPFYSNIEEYIQKWEKSKVKTIIAVTVDNKSLRRMDKLLVKIQELNSKIDIISAVGWHPWKVKKQSENPNFDFMEKKVKNSKIIGEIGLDYYFIKDPSVYPHQVKVFTFMLDLAYQFNIPCTIHSKNAEKELFNIVKNHGIDPGKLILHWYSGPIDLIKKFVNLGCNFSLTPAIEYSKHRKVAEIVPISHLFTESDGPVKYNGKLGEPSSIYRVLVELSKIKQSNINELAKQIQENFTRILN